MATPTARSICIVVLGAFVVGGCRNEGDGPGRAARGDSRIEQGQLPGVVLKPDEGLPGLEYDPSLSGPADPYLQRQFGASWPPAGYETSYQSYFEGPTPDDPEQFPVKKLRGLATLAMLFEGPEAASRYLNQTFPPSWRLDAPAFDTLGEERRGLVTEATEGVLADPKARPHQTTIVWRQGNLFLQLNVLGEYPLADVIPIARVVDDRAAALLAP
jgi:hypothetical protein